RLCGECDIGCNDGAKNTLDLTYLWRAQRAGARVVERCHVRDVTDLGDGGYLLRLRRFRLPEHPWVRSAPAAPLEVDLRAPVVVVAAGALGSTWLLLRSRRRAQSHPGLGLGRLDDTLGLRFSGNGDALGLMT